MKFFTINKLLKIEKYRKLISFSIIGLLLVFLTGCESAIKTNITVIGEGKAAVNVSVTLDSLTTDAVLADPLLDQQILDTMSTISNQGVQRSIVDNQLTYTLRANPTNLPADILGFSDLAVGSKGENIVTSLTLTKPDKLISAIEVAFSEEPDAKALSLTWQKSIKLVISFVTPGDIVLHSPEFFVSGNSAILEEYLSDWPSQQNVSIESAPSRFPLLPVGLIGGLLILSVIAFIVWRKR